MNKDLSQIHIWEAFENANTECAICDITRKSKHRLIESLFVEMVMDYNFQVSLGKENSFCKEHFQALYDSNDKLGLAILVDKILENERNKISNIKNNKPQTSNRYKPKKIFNPFTKGQRVDKLTKKECYLCHKIKSSVNNSIELLIMLWEKDEEFRNLYNSSKGFCMEHFNALMEIGNLRIKNKASLLLFKDKTIDLQLENNIRLQNELQWFIKKFNYLFEDEPWGTSRDSLIRSLIKINGIFK
jgi:hypothetical protein